MKTLANNTNETMNRVNDPAAAAAIVAQQKAFFEALDRRIKGGRAQETAYQSGKKVVRVYRIMTITATFEDGRAVSHSWAVGIDGVHYYKMTEKEGTGRRRTLATSTQDQDRAHVANVIMNLKKTARRAGAVLTWDSTTPAPSRRPLSLPAIEWAADMCDSRRRAAAIVSAPAEPAKELTPADLPAGHRHDMDRRIILNGIEYHIFNYCESYRHGEISILAGGRTIYKQNYMPCDHVTARRAAAEFLNKVVTMESTAPATDDQTSTNETSTAAPAGEFCPLTGETLTAAPADHLSTDEIKERVTMERDRVEREKAAKVAAAPADVLRDMYGTDDRAAVLSKFAGVTMERAAELLTITNEDSTATDDQTSTAAPSHYSPAAKVGTLSKVAAAALVLLSVTIGTSKKAARIYTHDPAAVLSAVAAAGETVTAYQVEEINAL
jgi:hypothetical protein